MSQNLTEYIYYILVDSYSKLGIRASVWISVSCVCVFFVSECGRIQEANKVEKVSVDACMNWNQHSWSHVDFAWAPTTFPPAHNTPLALLYGCYVRTESVEIICINCLVTKSSRVRGLLLFLSNQQLLFLKNLVAFALNRPCLGALHITSIFTSKKHYLCLTLLGLLPKLVLKL